MNDPLQPSHPFDAEPLHPLDELASAHLDGAADPIDVAAASGLAGFPERVARFEQVRSQLRVGGGTVDEVRREAAVAAALAAYDEQAVITAPRADTPAEAPRVTPIEVAAARRARPGRRWQLVGVAAAVAAGALALVPMLTRDADDGTGDLAVEAPAANDADALASEAARSADETTGGDGGGMATSLAAPKIGDFRSYDELAGAVRRELAPIPTADATPAPTTTATVPRVTSSLQPSSDTGTDTMAAPEQAGPTCPTSGNDAASSETSTSVVYGGEATVDGQPYDVEVTEDGTGHRTMTVRDPASCTVTDERPL